MTTRTDVANAVCVKLGIARIVTALDESEQARTINTAFDRVCRAELRKQAWSFALKRVSLPALLAAPAYGYAKQYALPDDLLRLVFINEVYVFSSVRSATNAPDADYVIEGRTLLTNNAAPLKMRYVSDVTQNPELWDACFLEAFACQLAREVLPSTTKNPKRAEELKADYKMAMAEARRCNAIELPPQPLADGSWIEARYL